MVISLQISIMYKLANIYILKINYLNSCSDELKTQSVTTPIQPMGVVKGD